MAVHNEEREQALVREFFADGAGFFVEVGANHPQNSSQSWHLEQRGWNGLLIEPLPQLAAKLREVRRSPVFEVACSSPTNRGLRLPFHVAGPMSSLDRSGIAPGTSSDTIIQVPISTLDDVLEGAAAPYPVDFLSVDVEGHEIEVLRGFDFDRWQPRLLLLEDHVPNLRIHRYVCSRGYRLVRRTGFNAWYVPPTCPIRFGMSDRWVIFRKYYLALPIRMMRNFSRKMRQPIKDRMRRPDISN